jgi:predicted kinase
MVSGLPGTGKSHFCRQLLEKLAAACVESDSLRKVLFSPPSYGADEIIRLLSLIHSLIDELLSLGVPVVYDATNLSERYREHLYHIAQRHRARLIVVRVEAPAEAVRQRLQHKASGGATRDASDADWQVYQRMKAELQPVRRGHFTVDTSRDIGPVMDKIVRKVNASRRGHA